MLEMGLQPGMKSQIYKRSMDGAPSGADSPGDEPPIPMIHADFPPFSQITTKETGASERTLHYQADQFEQQGMTSLFHKKSSSSPDKGRSLPPDMRQLIVDLKAEHSGFRPHEIATICFLRFGRKPSDHTVKRVLADGPKPSVTIRRYPPYA
jgi:hypothetical protein